MLEQDPFEELFKSFDLDDLREQRKKYLDLQDEYEQRANALTALIDIRERSDARGRRTSGNSSPPGEEQSRDSLTDMVRERFSKKPTLPNALATIMGDDNSSAWTVDQLMGELMERGWEPGGKTPRNSLDATLSRLTKMGVLERVEAGMYRKLPPGTPDGKATVRDVAETLL